MKNVFAILFFCHSYFAFGQVKFPLNDKGEIEYTEVVNIDSTSADKLYSRAKMSIAQMFKSAQNVIQNDDAVNKQVLIKGNIRADYSWNPLAKCPAHIDFTMTIFCKDNRNNAKRSNLFFMFMTILY
jgi:hypothetical protein